MNIDGTVDVKKFIIELSESLIDEFRHIELVDFYDVYQVLLAYWQETMSDDVFVLKYDGYMAGAEIVKIFKKETKKDDGKKKAEPKEIGWEGKLLSKTVIERVYFAKEQAEIERAEQVVAESESRLEEFVEENSGEGSVLADYAKEESEDLDAKKIAAKLKELKKQKTSDRGEEYEVLAKYTELATTAKNQAGIVKELNKALDESVKNKYAELTEKEIKDLLVKQKWSFDIFEGIKSLYDTTSHKIATRVTELADRYETTLPELDHPCVSEKVAWEVLQIRGRHDRLNAATHELGERDATSLVKLAHHVIQEEQGLFADHLGRNRHLGHLPRQDHRTLLTLASEASHVATAEDERHVVAVRTRERHATPKLLGTRPLHAIEKEIA